MSKYARRIFHGTALCLALTVAGSAGGSPWRIYENCRLMQDEFCDGDSFHVKSGRTHYIFRLYFVDAPETSEAYPERLAEQAAYFKTDPGTIRRHGEAATRFTRRFLSRPFTVYTKKEDARGNSDRKRYFARIRVGRKWLGDELVAHGLARIYGWQTDLPDGTPARKHVANLRVIERSAKRKGSGAWTSSR